MKYTIVIISMLMLLTSLKSFSQNSSIKGKCIYYNGSYLTSFLVGMNFYTHSGKRFGKALDTDGSFEFKIGDEAGDIIVNCPNCYTIKILNLPSGFRQIDLGEIKMVDSFHKHLFRMDGSLAYMDKETIDEHNCLRKDVLEKYRIRVLKRELKPHFSGENLIFDFNKGSSLKSNSEK